MSAATRYGVRDHYNRPVTIDGIDGHVATPDKEEARTTAIAHARESEAPCLVVLLPDEQPVMRCTYRGGIFDAVEVIEL